MNRQIVINQNMQKLRQSNRCSSHINCIRLTPNRNMKEHNRKIIELCEEYLYTGVEFITEAIFVDGQRADIYLPYLDEAIEVGYSEKELDPKKHYPVNRVTFIKIGK